MTCEIFRQITLQTTEREWVVFERGTRSSLSPPTPLFPHFFKDTVEEE